MLYLDRKPRPCKWWRANLWSSGWHLGKKKTPHVKWPFTSFVPSFWYLCGVDEEHLSQLLFLFNFQDSLIFSAGFAIHVLLLKFGFKELKTTAKIFPDFAGRVTLLIDVLTSTHMSVGYAASLRGRLYTIERPAVYFPKALYVPGCRRLLKMRWLHITFWLAWLLRQCY